MAKVAGLDVAGIVRTSIAIGDLEGFERLTMRRLSAELDVTPMAIYHHVSGKEELLDLVLDESLRPLPLPDVKGDPLEQIVGWYHAFHLLLVAHPELARVMSDRRLEGPVAAAAAERMMTLAERAGLSGSRVVDLIVAAFSFSLGSSFFRTSRLAAEATKGDRGDAAPPVVGRIRDRLARAAADDEHFLEALTMLVAAYLEPS